MMLNNPLPCLIQNFQKFFFGGQFVFTTVQGMIKTSLRQKQKRLYLIESQPSSYFVDIPVITFQYRVMKLISHLLGDFMGDVGITITVTPWPKTHHLQIGVIPLM